MRLRIATAALLSLACARSVPQANRTILILDSGTEYRTPLVASDSAARALAGTWIVDSGAVAAGPIPPSYVLRFSPDMFEFVLYSPALGDSHARPTVAWNGVWGLRRPARDSLDLCLRETRRPEGACFSLTIGKSALFARRVDGFIAAHRAPPADTLLPANLDWAGRDSVPTFFEFEVSKRASLKSAMPPQLPSDAVPHSGVVIAQWVIKPDGRPDMTTFRILKTDGEALSAAVREAVNKSTYTPGELYGRKVRSVVQQRIDFK